MDVSRLETGYYAFQKTLIQVHETGHMYTASTHCALLLRALSDFWAATKIDRIWNVRLVPA